MPSSGSSSAACFSRQQAWADPKKIIPLPENHIPRTNSELQLEINKEAAKLHEYQMYDRIMRSVMRKRDQAEIRSPAEKGDFHPSPRCISGLPHAEVSYPNNREVLGHVGNSTHNELAKPSGSRGFLPNPVDDYYDTDINEEEGYGYFQPTSPPIIEYTSTPDNPNKRMKNLSEHAYRHCQSSLCGTNSPAAPKSYYMQQNTLSTNEDVPPAPLMETKSLNFVQEGIFALDL